MTINFVTAFLLPLIFFANIYAADKTPPPEALGVRLNMSEDEARERLKRIGTQKKEEQEREGEGEQEVWLLRDRRFSFLVVAFDREHKVRLIIATVRKGARVRYEDLGDTKAARQATDGRNYSYTWLIKPEGERQGYAVIARGGDPRYLTSYTVNRLAR